MVRDPEPFKNIGIALVVFGIMVSLPSVDNFLIDFTSLSVNGLQLLLIGLMMFGFHFLYKPAKTVFEDSLEEMG